MRKIFKLFPAVLPLGFLALTLALRLTFPDFFEDIRLRVFDRFQKISPRSYSDFQVRIVDIDDETLARFGQWPWPRTLIAELVSKLEQAGAAAVVLDAIFPEPDRTSPEQVFKLWPAQPSQVNLRSLLQTLPDHDLVLAEALAKTHAILSFSLTYDGKGRNPAAKAGFAFAGDDPGGYLPNFTGVVPNLEALERTAAGNGSFNIFPERDGILRRVPLLLKLRGQLYPSVTAETLRVLQGAGSYIVQTSGATREANFGAPTGITRIKIGRSVIPTDRDGRLWLYDTGFKKERMVPAWRVLESKDSLPALRGKIAFIGTSAAGLKDIRATPLDPVAAGVTVHAQIVEQILTRNFLRRPDWAEGAEFLAWVSLGLLLVFLMPHVGALGCAALAAAGIVSAFLFSWQAFRHFGLLLDPFVPSLLTLSLYLITSLLNYLRTESERKHIRTAFSHYLAPGLVEELVKHPEKLALGGQTRPMTVLFSDIRDFTTLSESLSAQQLAMFMNHYLTRMTGIILELDGTIDKYIGDCIMAFWNAPLGVPDHAGRAIKAALAMQASLAQWNKESSKKAIAMGIGINTGDCSVGNMGSDQRFDYTVLGDEVNLASRLEGLCKLYGVPVIAGEKTALAAGGFAFLELDLIRVKGKSMPSRIYAVMGDEKKAGSPEFQSLARLHESMLQDYRARRWESALKNLEDFEQKIAGRDGLSKLLLLYRKRIQLFQKETPPMDWDGVFTAEFK